MVLLLVSKLNACPSQRQHDDPWWGLKTDCDHCTASARKSGCGSNFESFENLRVNKPGKEIKRRRQGREGFASFFLVQQELIVVRLYLADNNNSKQGYNLAR